MRKLKTSNKHFCVVCGRIDTFEGSVTQDQKYLCPNCFKEVRKEFEKQNPGQSLRANEESEQ